MRFVSRIGTGFSTVGELIRGLWRGPFWWLVPLVTMLLPAALLFIFLQTVPLVAPFVYTVF